MAAVEPDFAKPGVTPEKCTMPQLKLKCWMHARGLDLPSDCNLKQQHVDRVKAALEIIAQVLGAFAAIQPSHPICNAGAGLEGSGLWG